MPEMRTLGVQYGIPTQLNRPAAEMRQEQHQQRQQVSIFDRYTEYSCHKKINNDIFFFHTHCTISCMGGTTIELSTGSAVAITAVLCSVVFLLIGFVLGLLTHYCLSSTAKRRAQYSVSSSSTEPQTPAPVYEEISATDTKPKAIELSENIAYGPARR